MAVKIGIVNQKGGVGKTTTAINLSAGIALAEKKVILVDMDAQANATSGLGIGKNGNSIYNVLLEPTRIEQVIKKIPVPGFPHILPSSIDLAGLSVEIENDSMWMRRLEYALKLIDNKYDYIIIDSPPSLSFLTINTMVASDKLIIPVQCEYFALEGLSELINTYKKIKAVWNPELDILGILLTMYDERLNLSKQVAEDVVNAFKNKVFETKIPRNVKVAESPSFGQSILHYDLKSQGAQAYLSLTKEILEYE